ncbi:hypothetical protein BDV93DRAFT_456535 [Ceratobasidium sp. AG-I]|nr:hypothetical protein BDV93DRAFT_456535 [Ceratobasidium sp. AG-I]
MRACGNARTTSLAECNEASSPHPFLHAKVLGIFHAEISLPGQNKARLAIQRFDFLWV